MVPACGAFSVVASSVFWAVVTASCAWATAAWAWATVTGSGVGAVVVVVDVDVSPPSPPWPWFWPWFWLPAVVVVVGFSAWVSFSWAAARLALADCSPTWADDGSMVASTWPAATFWPGWTFTEVRVPP